ncbi:MAG: RNA polymerase sigma factor [Oscillospiraceae bacterium]
MKDFEEIYRLYVSDVYGFLYKLSRNADIAEELTSETFYRAVKNIDSYKGNCKMSVWLISISKNLYYDYIKKKENNNISIGDTDYSDNSDIAENLEDKEMKRKIHKILHTLDEPFKEVFSLRVFSELSFKDIGELFEKSDGWARIVFFRAKEKIVNKLKDE